jgi:transposase-like protein
VKNHEIGPILKKSKFSEAQIVYAKRENESGTKGAEIARRLGISQATFFTWEKKYGDSVMLPEFQTKGLVKLQTSNPCSHEHQASPSPLQQRIQIESGLRRFERASILG